MDSHELTTGRTFGVRFDHGEDFYTSLANFCRTHGVHQGYIPMFLAGFSEVELVGTCERLDEPEKPLWARVHLTNIEALGVGTLAYDPDEDKVLPHVHVAVGLKGQSAVGHTSHLLSASVQFLTEMVVVEVTAPTLSRQPDAALFDVPLLSFGAG